MWPTAMPVRSITGELPSIIEKARSTWRWERGEGRWSEGGGRGIFPTSSLAMLSLRSPTAIEKIEVDDTS
eukprot:2764210-Pleurochrysis_carterae.AAC.1